MQIKNLITLALVGFATAAPFAEPKSIDVVKNSLTAIVTALDTLDAAVTGLAASSDAAKSFVDLTAKSSAVLAALQKGTTDIAPVTPLTLGETAGINSFSAKLTASSQKVVADFIAKHDLIVKAGKGADVVSAMQAQYTATKLFSTAIKSKVPVLAQGLVDTASQAGITALEVCLLHS